MKPDFFDPHHRPGLLDCARMGALYGAATGLLVGFVYLALARDVATAPIVALRNFILGGAAVGLLIGSVLRLWSSSAKP